MHVIRIIQKLDALCKSDRHYSAFSPWVMDAKKPGTERLSDQFRAFPDRYPTAG